MSDLCVCAVVCVQAVSVRLCLYLARLLCGGRGTGSAARCDWSPLAAWGPCGAQNFSHSQTAYTSEWTLLHIHVYPRVNNCSFIWWDESWMDFKWRLCFLDKMCLKGITPHSSPVWDLLRFLGLRLRVCIPSFFIARGRATCKYIKRTE